MLTLLLVSADRHSAIVRGNGNNAASGGGLLPMRWAVALAWAVSVGLVLPYSAYIKYIDLSVSGDFNRCWSGQGRGQAQIDWTLDRRPIVQKKWESGKEILSKTIPNSTNEKGGRLVELH